ncbi:MAG: hypothetical protein Q9227_004436 [Pyrenula ochraceoflavens]
MEPAESETDELARKRQRNRVAQRKYRKKLKSHIEDLEKRAATADQLQQKSTTAFSFSEDNSWSNPKNLVFHGVEGMGINSDNVGAGQSPRIAPRQYSAKDSNAFSPRLTKSPPASNLLGVLGAEVTPPMEPRIECVLQSIRSAGFESADSFMSCYYTSTFKDKSTAKVAQEISRMKGLPQLLEDLKTGIGSWPTRESSGYRDMIVQSAAPLIGDELERLTRKKYSCEVELQQTLSHTTKGSVSHSSPAWHQMQSMAAELKKTLRDEVQLSQYRCPYFRNFSLAC